MTDLDTWLKPREWRSVFRSRLCPPLDDLMGYIHYPHPRKSRLHRHNHRYHRRPNRHLTPRSPLPRNRPQDAHPGVSKRGRCPVPPTLARVSRVRSPCSHKKRILLGGRTPNRTAPIAVGAACRLRNGRHRAICRRRIRPPAAHYRLPPLSQCNIPQFQIEESLQIPFGQFPRPRQPQTSYRMEGEVSRCLDCPEPPAAPALPGRYRRPAVVSCSRRNQATVAEDRMR